MDILLIISILIALFFAYFFRVSLIDSMSNVKPASEAQEYLKRDTVNITTSIDTYLYTNISVVPKDRRTEENQDTDNDDDSDNDFDDDSDSDDGGSDGGDGGD